MSEPIKKLNPKNPEGYSPKKPMLLKALEEAQKETKPYNIITSQPVIMTKKFMLAGFEAAIDLNESHWNGMDEVKSSLKDFIGKIGNKAQPIRFIGMWEANSNVDYSKPENHSKRLYFYGVEVLSLEDIPIGCVIKDLPESRFAVFKEKEHGSPKYDYLSDMGYAPDREFQQKYALDMEIFNEIDNDGDEWDVVIPIQTDPESYSPKTPILLNMIEETNQKGIHVFPEQFSVTERGVREEGRHCPHTMAFPTMISALKVFFGMKSRVIEKDGWLQDMDYYFQMGITTEGFALFHGTPYRYSIENRWDDIPLRNSLSAEGIHYHIAAVSDKFVHDSLIDPGTLKEEICKHLAQDKPLLIVGGSKEGDRNLLVTGYKESGETMIAYPFQDGYSDRNTAVKLKANCKDYDDWRDNLYTVIYIDGYGEPSGRGEIIRQALQIAYEMLTDTQLVCDMDEGGYLYGEALYQKWIARLGDDANYRRKKDKHRYLHPEEFDFAERRCYASDFFMECEEYLGQGVLSLAYKAFRDIHDKMWHIHGLAMDENDGKLLERETREAIIAVLKECHELDLIAAENIKQVLRSMGS